MHPPPTSESVKSLSAHEQQVLSLRFEWGMCRAEVAHRVGITVSAVDDIIALAIDRVRKAEACKS